MIYLNRFIYSTSKDTVMSPTRTINVVTLSLILLLAGCFGLGDSAEADSNDDYEPNAAPVLHGELMLDDQNGELEFYQADCDGTNCAVTAYHAAVDPDGDTFDLGYDFDLDGVIDYQLTNNMGMTDLSVPISNFISETILVDEIREESDCVDDQMLVVTNTYTYSMMITTIAVIATDSHGASSAILLTANDMYNIENATSSEIETCDENSGGNFEFYSFSDRDASGAMGETTDDALVHVQLTQGDSLNWATLRVSIVVDGGASNICDADSGDAACVFMTDGETTWDVAEEITIKENGQDLCDGQDGGCEITVTLTKIGVGGETDKIIATVTAYADATQ